MSQSLLYFAYGSNLHPLRLRERAPSSRCVALAELVGYQLCFHKSGRDGSGKCNVSCTGGRNERVLGALYELACSDKVILDEVESLGAGYHQRQLSLCGPDGSREAFTYAADPDYVDDSMQPYEWYRELVLWGARYHRFSDSYISAIAFQRAVVDPVPERPNNYQRLLRAMQDLSRQGYPFRTPTLYRAVMR